MLRSFAELTARCGKGKPRRLVAAAAHDAHTLEAVFEAADRLGCAYRLVGDRPAIVRLSRELGREVPAADITDADGEADCAEKAVALIRRGEGDVLMKGLLQTAALLHAVLSRETGIRGAGVLSHLSVIESPRYPKLLGITDGGMIPYPTLRQKQAIIQNAAGFFRALGAERPKVAVLAAVETVSEAMPETGEAAELARLFAGSADCLVEGPLALDLAVSRASADAKGIKSAVAGEADILVVPTVAAGNMLTKGLLFLGGAKMAGCVLGAAAPIVLVSRGATAEEKFLSVLLCLSAGQAPRG